MGRPKRDDLFGGDAMLNVVRDLPGFSEDQRPVLLGYCPSPNRPGELPLAAQSNTGRNVRRWWRDTYPSAPCLDDLFELENLIPVYTTVKHCKKSGEAYLDGSTRHCGYPPRVVVAMGAAGRSLCDGAGMYWYPPWYSWHTIPTRSGIVLMCRVPHCSGRTRLYNDISHRRHLSGVLAAAAYMAWRICT